MYKVIVPETFRKEVEKLKNKNLEQIIYKKLKTLEEDADVATLLKMLKIPENEAKIIMINGKNSQIGDKPKEGDIIALFPPVGGGSSL